MSSKPSATSTTPAMTRNLPNWKGRSEEHTSELQSHLNLVCRLLLEKKKKNADLPYHLKPVCRCYLEKIETLFRVVVVLPVPQVDWPGGNTRHVHQRSEISATRECRI